MQSDILVAVFIFLWVGIGFGFPGVLAVIVTSLAALALTAVAGLLAVMMMRGMARILRDIWHYIPSD